MQLRADVLGRAIECTEAPDSAFGSAVLAASGSLFGSLEEATRRMVRRSRRFEPRPERRGQYDDLYLRFRDECARRGIG
jgi:sugar (pentulose or hexulose) kinase